MKHDQARELLPEYALDLMEPGPRLDLDDHVEECPLCQLEAPLYQHGVAALVAATLQDPQALSLEPGRDWDGERGQRVTALLRERLGVAPVAPTNGAVAVAVTAAEGGRKLGRWRKREANGAVALADDEEFATDILDLFGPPDPDGEPAAEAAASAVAEVAGTPLAEIRAEPNAEDDDFSTDGLFAEVAAVAAAAPSALIAPATAPAEATRMPAPAVPAALTDDEDFSTEGFLEEMLGRRPAPGRPSATAGATAAPAVAGAPRAAAEDEFDYEPEHEGSVGGGWRASAILFGLMTAGLAAALVYGFFQLLDSRDKADQLEQQQQFYSLYFTFQNDVVQGTIYLNPPTFSRGLLMLDIFEPLKRGRQLVVWSETSKGEVQLVRQLLLGPEQGRHEAPLFQLPKDLKRIFLTEERSPFKGDVPTGAEVGSALAPIVE